MKQIDFVNRYAQYALQTEQEAGISAIFTLAQAALESGWGESAPGNMFFGVKDTDGINGNEQLLTTTEYFKTGTVQPTTTMPVIISKVQVAVNRWKYRVKAYFRKYPTPYECFFDHSQLFKLPRYRTEAMEEARKANDPRMIADAVAAAGYATAPNYAISLKRVIDMIEPIYNDWYYNKKQK